MLVLNTVAFHAHNVADVPGFELSVQVFAHIVLVQENLDAAGAVLQRGEAGFAHDPLEHHAPGHLDVLADFGQCFFVEAVVVVVQIGGYAIGTEIVGVGYAGGPQFGQLAAPFGYQVIFVDS